MAAEAAGRAYITKDLDLKASLNACSEAWVALGEKADEHDALVRDLLP